VREITSEGQESVADFFAVDNNNNRRVYPRTCEFTIMPVMNERVYYEITLCSFT